MSGTQERRITIRDVAREAGVAISTVSAALNGDGRVKEATRRRVLAVATALDYRPNRAAAMLASRQYRDPATVAAIPVAFLTSMQRDPWKSGNDVMLGAQQRAGELGYAFRHVELDAVESVAALGRVLHARGVEGVLVGRMWPVPPRTLDLPWDKFAVVYCGRDHPGDLRAHGVEHDTFESTLRLFRIAEARGYVRIGVCLRDHEPRLLDDDARLGAVLAAQAALPPARRVEPYRGRAGVAGPEERKRLAAWVRRVKPDAVIGFSDGDHWMLQQAGFRMPEQFGYAALHANPAGTRRQEECTSGYVQERRRLGAAAMELLDQQIRYRHRGLTDAPLSLHMYSRFRDGYTLPRRA